jgi:electron transport complex protein RnfG
VLPRELYDNDLLNDSRRCRRAPPSVLDEATTAYLARKAGRAARWFSKPSPRWLCRADPPAARRRRRRHAARRARHAAQGDTRPRRLHRAAQGPNKERPWIRQFDGLSLATVADREWRVRKDGGRFDSVAGATVTPRAVIKAVHKALQYVAENRQQLCSRIAARYGAEERMISREEFRQIGANGSGSRTRAWCRFSACARCWP